VFTDEQKRRMIEKVTEAQMEVQGEAMRSVTFVLIEEVKAGDWAVDGKFPEFPEARS
jgi:4-oxalocrotonate tautomerase